MINTRLGTAHEKVINNSNIKKTHTKVAQKDIALVTTANGCLTSIVGNLHGVSVCRS